MAKRDQFEFLPAALEVLETPPRPAARFILFAICAFFASALTWAIVGRIDTVAVAQGQVVPRGRVKQIQPLENGIIRTIHVKDGQAVRKGDPLITLDPTETEANVETLRYDLLKARLDAATALARLAEDPEQALVIPAGAKGVLLEASLSEMRGLVERALAATLAIDAEIEEQKAALINYRQQLEKANADMPLVEERLADLTYLDQKQLARKPELQQAKLRRIDTVAEIATAKSNIAQTKARIAARERKRAEAVATHRGDALEKRSEALRKIASLKQQLLKEERRRKDRTLRAPINGVVAGLSVFTESGVVTTKDPLMRIVPENSVLIVEAFVLNKDIGFVAEGQDVELKLETFPFTRYGLINGKVLQIWRDATQDESRGLVYKAEISLKETRILVGKAWQKITPGMSVQAEIQTGKRRAISFFLSPFLRYRDESLRER
ncbi:MAG: HlyD family type I secretion periplasmic adaptor subunit [Hyphomicrobiaceae bacterium]